MRILRDSSPVPLAQNPVVALGNFDGLHLGHQAVISQAIKLARQSGRPAAVLTFEPHPREVFSPTANPLRLLPLREKIWLLREMGVDWLRLVRFTPGFARTSASDFVQRVLYDRMGASQVVTGEDFRFGRNREGDVAFLAAEARKLGFGASVCPPFAAGGMRCSSSRIREALAAGKVEEAARLLGRPHAIYGRVRSGDRRGRELGFPTANILPGPVFAPAFGIYAVKATLNGVAIPGVASFGLRPQFPLSKPLLEVHLFDWQGDLYGQRLEVALLHYLRLEGKFETVEALKKQMGDDCGKAKSLLY